LEHFQLWVSYVVALLNVTIGGTGQEVRQVCTKVPPYIFPSFVSIFGREKYDVHAPPQVI
jgi:hypothetical protein